MSEPSEFAARIAAAKASGDFTQFAVEIPFARMLGLGLELVHPGGDAPVELRGRLAFAPQNIGNSALPALHGGTIAALLETTAIMQLLWQQDAAELPKTISITIEYLRSGKPVETWARAVVTRAGRRVANVRVMAWQDDAERPIATANAILLVGSPPT